MSHPIFRTLMGTLMCGSLMTGALGCASPERLRGLDRRFYQNLDSEKDRAAYLKTPKAQRQSFLQSQGIWDRWQALPEAERTAAKRGQLAPGSQEFAGFMAWGPPADTQRRTAGEREVAFHTFIRCTSGPKTGRYVQASSTCDGTFNEIEVAVEGGIVTEIKVLN
ncbi:hypothetical protein [Nannocystis bainbridge]|uniref:Lipoprotein n=1 Tax=Nannocystis bainbridge TaxID=2995303 RepID=A0ABT5EDW6_9BACT|nr:hypothetical protein [Nannocystis bainbridge]MDC0723123.1 hypothetical protein [Nannocystis bainbridge]